MAGSWVCHYQMDSSIMVWWAGWIISRTVWVFRVYIYHNPLMMNHNWFYIQVRCVKLMLGWGCRMPAKRPSWCSVWPHGLFGSLAKDYNSHVTSVAMRVLRVTVVHWHPLMRIMLIGPNSPEEFRAEMRSKNLRYSHLMRSKAFSELRAVLFKEHLSTFRYEVKYVKHLVYPVSSGHEFHLITVDVLGHDVVQSVR